MAAKDEVLAELGRLRDRLSHVTGALVATVDGLLVAHDTRDVEPDTVAAMSPAQLGLGRQLARGLAHGESRESVIRTDSGYVAVFAAGEEALVAIVADPELNLGRLHHEARPLATRVGDLLAAAEQPAPPATEDRR